MATTPTPATVQTIDTELKSEVTKVESWFKAHEKILIVAILALTTLFLGNKFLDTVATRDRAAATQAAQVLTQQQTLNQTLAAQVAAAQQNNQALIVQLSQQNAVLQTQQTQRTVVLTQQVATDKTLPLPDLGNRWAQLTKAQPGDITANTNGLEVTPAAAVATVTQLEQLPVAQSNLDDVTKQRDNLNQELDSTKTLNSSLVTQVDGLNTQIKDEGVSCKAQIASVKADARKGKLKSFGIGVGVGVGAVLILAAHLF